MADKPSVYGLSAHQGTELAIILKHLDAMVEELSDLRGKTHPERSWGDGFWLSLKGFTVEGDADEHYGRIEWDDFQHRFYAEEYK